MDKKQLKQLAKQMKKHPELAKQMKAHPEMAQKLQAAAQKGGKEMNAALKQMDEQMEWFRALSAQERSWIGMVVQAGIRAFATRTPLIAPIS